MVTSTEYIDLNLHSTSKQENMITNQLELFFQEVEIAIKTFPGDVWGVTNFLNINRYVFNRYISITQIKNEIMNYIENNCACASKYNWRVNVKLYSAKDTPGQKGDLVYIELVVDRDAESGQFVNKYVLGSGGVSTPYLVR